jgi:hypothetical protein
MPNLMTMWPNVSCDTAIMAGRLTSFAEMLLIGSAILRLAFLHKTKFFHS